MSFARVILNSLKFLNVLVKEVYLLLFCFLFILMIYCITNTIIVMEKFLGNIHIPVILFADKTTLISSSHRFLRESLNAEESYDYKWKLHYNPSKFILLYLINSWNWIHFLPRSVITKRLHMKCRLLFISWQIG